MTTPANNPAVRTINAVVRSADSLDRSAAELSPRERQTLRCLLDGMTVAEIAKTVGASQRTVTTQKHAAYRKLGISSDSELNKMRTRLNLAPGQ
ncbi:helix-turn-helix transcriptional regulator [Nocardia sp. NPDC006630]|uniref:helix-turn-helix domain-containing protein n=1 Tax=Nocardia sp. NPDC006630 TaxID=3157181 RepID=UPI00339DD5A4